MEEVKTTAEKINEVVPKEKIIGKVFEFQFNGRTYITKKVNNKRLGLLSQIFSVKDENQLEVITNSAYVIWQFIKDEDKKDLTFEYFEDELDLENSNTIDFITWAVDNITNMSKIIKSKNDQASQERNRGKK